MEKESGPLAIGSQEGRYSSRVAALIETSKHLQTKAGKGSFRSLLRQDPARALSCCPHLFDHHLDVLSPFPFFFLRAPAGPASLLAARN
jgi:hypothetical protein